VGPAFQSTSLLSGGQNPSRLAVASYFRRRPGGWLTRYLYGPKNLARRLRPPSESTNDQKAKGDQKQREICTREVTASYARYTLRENIDHPGTPSRRLARSDATVARKLVNSQADRGVIASGERSTGPKNGL